MSLRVEEFLLMFIPIGVYFYPGKHGPARGSNSWIMNASCRSLLGTIVQDQMSCGAFCSYEMCTQSLVPSSFAAVSVAWEYLVRSLSTQLEDCHLLRTFPEYPATSLQTGTNRIPWMGDLGKLPQPVNRRLDHKTLMTYSSRSYQPETSREQQRLYTHRHLSTGD